jgi:pyruvate dehydrogenase E2 component (dihydrolipoamide acetyltransferase)
MTEASMDGRRSEPIAFDAIRRAIAKRVTESAALPTFTATAIADVEALMTLRAEFNARLGATGQKVSVNDFIVRAVTLALAHHPEVNASYSGEGRGQILMHDRINIGLAVDSPAGLMTPVLRDADQDSLTEIARKTRDVVTRARLRKLGLPDMADGTFTISNLGMFGVDHFAALIVPPQGAILAVGAAAEQLKMVDGKIVARRVLSCTLTADHRIIDGVLAARFLGTLTTLLENPTKLGRTPSGAH